MSDNNSRTTIRRRGFIAVMVGAVSGLWGLLGTRRSKLNGTESAKAPEPKPPKWIGHM